MKHNRHNKPYSVFIKRYRFLKYTRKLQEPAEWKYYRSYMTIQGAKDAVKAFHSSKAYPSVHDYPGEEYEKEYPHITPTITIKRYKIVKNENH